MTGTNRLATQSLLDDADFAAIDALPAEADQADALPGLVALMKEQFACELNTDPDIVTGFAADSSNLPGNAVGVCRPRTERQCAAVLRACSRLRLPVTLSGGKSNLTGSATPPGGIVLSTVNLLDPPVTVDTEAGTAVVPVGMVLEDMRHAVEAQSEGKWVFPVDPTSRSDASVGGCIACNASGFTPGETGATRAWVQAIRFLLPDGRMLAARRGDFVSEGGVFVLPSGTDDQNWPVPRYTRPAIKNAGGPFSAPDGRMDLVDLVVGSEGLFGLVTSVTLQLAPRPADHLDLFFSLRSEADALRMLDAARQRFDGDFSRVAAFEYFGPHCRVYMKHENRFFRDDDAVGLYIREPLFDADPLTAAEGWLDTIGSADLDIPEEAILLLDTPALQDLFMEARHSMPANAVEVVQRRGTFTIMTDTVVPPDRFAEFLEYAHTRISSRQLDYLAFGHMGDCHLHFTILPAADQLADAEAAYDDIVARSADLGGVYSGEHGTGKRKRKDFLRCYGPDAVEQVKRCKAAVDPDFLVNRGNVFESD